MTAPSAFLVIQPQEFDMVRRNLCIGVSTFQDTPSKNFWKLMPTKQYAMDTALAAFTTLSARSATEPTRWIMIELKFTEKQWMMLFCSDNFNTAAVTHMTRGPTNSTWYQYRVFGDIPLYEGSGNILGAVEYDIYEFSWPAIGMEVWAEKCLAPRLARGWEFACCQQCGTFPTQVWWADDLNSPLQGKSRRPYCIKCWMNWLLHE